MSDQEPERFVTWDEHEEIMTEYRALAERNRGLISKFSTKVTWLLAGLIVIQLALGVFSIILLEKTDNLGKANTAALTKIDKETANRLDQSCTKQEREFKDKVRGLNILYNFVQDLTPAQRQDPLNALLIKNIPQSEKDVLLSKAPAFCDKPGVGLAENPTDNPPIPKRPPGVDALLKNGR